VIVAQGAAIAFGSLCTLLFLFFLYKGVRIRSWKKHRAKVIETRSHRKFRNLNGPSNDRYSGTNTNQVRLVYTLDGKKHTTDFISLGTDTMASDSVSGFEKLYSKGKEVDIYYNSDNPDQITPDNSFPIDKVVLTFVLAAACFAALWQLSTMG